MQKGMKDHGQGLKIGIEIEIAIVIGIRNRMEIGNEREIRKATEDDQGLLLILFPSKEFHNNQVWADACTKSRMMARKNELGLGTLLLTLSRCLPNGLPANICTKSTIETLEKGVIYVQKQQNDTGTTSNFVF